MADKVTFSKEEIEGKLNEMLVNFAKQYGKENAPETTTPVSVKRFGFGDSEAKSGRYGGVFKKN